MSFSAFTARAAGGALALTAALAIALAAPAALAQAVVARVNGTPITLEQLDLRFEQVLRERNLNIARITNPKQVRDLKREALDALVGEELLWQKAQQEKLVVDDATVEDSLRKTAAQFRNPGAFQRSLTRQGFDEASYRTQVRKLLSGDRYAQRVVEQKVTVSDADVAAFYRENQPQFVQPEKLRLRHILVRVAADAPAAELAQARGRIDELQRRAAAGENFDQLARNHSDDATRQWGGELDPFARGSFEPAFEDAAFALQPGAVSPVVRSSAGFHVLRLEARIPAVNVTLAQASPQIRAHLQGRRGQQAVKDEIAALRAAADVQLLMPQ